MMDAMSSGKGGDGMTDRQLAKRRRILEAAGKEFARLGYEHCAIRDIARRAGVADGTIYSYFENKQALVMALVAELTEGLGQAESRPLGLTEPGRLEDRIGQRMAALHDQYEMLAAVLPVILGSPELRQHFRDGFLEPVIAGMEIEIGGEEAALKSRMLLAAVLGFQVLMLLGDEATHRAWDEPDALVSLWSGVIRSISGSRVSPNLGAGQRGAPA